MHKPSLYIRFEEIDNVHFARSDVSTRSFDFEILKKPAMQWFLVPLESMTSY